MVNIWLAKLIHLLAYVRVICWGFAKSQHPSRSNLKFCDVNVQFLLLLRFYSYSKYNIVTKCIIIKMKCIGKIDCSTLKRTIKQWRTTSRMLVIFQPVHIFLIMASKPMVLKSSLDNVNKPSQYCKSSKYWEATVYLMMFHGETPSVLIRSTFVL